jgi:hypothetical protein
MSYTPREAFTQLSQGGGEKQIDNTAKTVKSFFKDPSGKPEGEIASVASSDTGRNPARGCAPPMAAEQAGNRAFQRGDLHA